MLPLDQDLQQRKISLNDFREVAIRVLEYLPNVISGRHIKDSYAIYSSIIAGTTKYVRPVNQKLFIAAAQDFRHRYQAMIDILERISNKNETWTAPDKHLIDSVLYTIQQSIGAGLDLLVTPNSARKHVGNRFEELIKAVFTKVGISNNKTILQIPYSTGTDQKIYKCENDLILSPFDRVRSTNQKLDESEIIVSVKTTSKDRMGKMFIDKILLERFVKHPQKVIGIFLNDVQRKNHDNISYTLVSGLFMVYSNFLVKLDGVYYLDPPPIALRPPYDEYIKPFSELLFTEVRQLLST